MMTGTAYLYASRLRHNSSKRLSSIYLTAALTAALTLSQHSLALAGNENGGSIYFQPTAQPVLQEGRAADEQRPAAPAPAPAGSVGAAPGIFAMVTEAAQRHGVPVGLAHAIIKIESGYDCHAHSRIGAAGIGQVLPASARAEGVSGNLYDCSTGLEASMRYLKHAVTVYGDSCAAASAYNTGIVGRGRCTGYGRLAMRLAQSMR
jgi:soluble lytic murein transglycosylase-like protein